MRHVAVCTQCAICHMVQNHHSLSVSLPLACVECSLVSMDSVDTNEHSTHAMVDCGDIHLNSIE